MIILPGQRSQAASYVALARNRSSTPACRSASQWRVVHRVVLAIRNIIETVFAVDETLFRLLLFNRAFSAGGPTTPGGLGGKAMKTSAPHRKTRIRCPLP